MSGQPPEPGRSPQPLIHPSGQACRECGAQLDVLQAARGVLCGAPECARRGAVRADLERQARERRQADAELARARTLGAELVRERMPGAPARYAAYPVPDNRRRLVPADPQRVEAFRAHLDALLAGVEPGDPQPAAANHAEASAPDGPDEAAPAAAPPVLEGFACATCRGQCCAGGGTHAFLNEQDLARWFARHPGQGREACRDAYLERIGRESYEESCVFHGEAGCTLDRDLRSGTCNRYSCRSLDDLRRLHEAAPAPVGVLIAFDRGQATRVRIVDTAGAGDLGEHDLPA